ncbi:hypothetical protein Gpo141_00010875 [Globisporangium polare]
MFSMPASKTLLLALAAFAAATADAHSKMSLPKPTWDNGYGTNSPSGTIDGPSALKAPSGMSFSTDPTSNTKAFTAALKASSYSSLKALAFATQKTESGATKECGFSKSTGAAQPLPDVVQWDELTPSHEGPCEVWCDGTMAFHGDNCAKTYTGSPAKLPYDKSKCSGAKMLTSIWLALHTPTWQVYTNCAPLSGGGGGGGSSGATSTTTAPAPASGGGNSGASTTGGTGDNYTDGTTSGATSATTSENTNTGGSSTSTNTGGNTNTGSNTNKNTGNSNKNNNKNTGNSNNNNNKNTGNNSNKNSGNGRSSWTFGK